MLRNQFVKTGLWVVACGLWVALAALAQAPADQPLWKEYGLVESSQATCPVDGKQIPVTAYRFQDSTGALGAFDWQRSAGGASQWMLHHNYVLSFAGARPKGAELDAFLKSLKKVNNAPLPNLADYLPKGRMVANSERYVLGPVALERFAPAIPASVAAFDMGAEAQLARYDGNQGPFDVAIFSYPTPQIARLRLAEFEKLPGMVVKRTGPLVVAVIAPKDAQAAAKLISGVEYQANITLNERVPTPKDNVGELLLNIVYLAGILMGLCLAGGIVLGVLRRGLRGNKEQEPMIVLHLGDRQS